MKKRIENTEDVHLLVTSFYNKVLKDETLSPFFSYVKNNHWDKHLKVLESFWNNIFFLYRRILWQSIRGT